MVITENGSFLLSYTFRPWNADNNGLQNNLLTSYGNFCHRTKEFAKEKDWGRQ